MFWQNKKKIRFFDECRAILDFLRKWLLKFDVLPHWDAVFCAAVCMLAMKHSVANVPREQQLYWWC